LHHIVIAVLLGEVACLKVGIYLSSLFVDGDDFLLLFSLLLAVSVICIQTLTFRILEVRVQSQLVIERCQVCGSV
jgi:hypothetical protein